MNVPVCNIEHLVVYICIYRDNRLDLLYTYNTLEKFIFYIYAVEIHNSFKFNNTHVNDYDYLYSRNSYFL